MVLLHVGAADPKELLTNPLFSSLLPPLTLQLPLLSIGMSWSTTQQVTESQR